MIAIDTFLATVVGLTLAASSIIFAVEMTDRIRVVLRMAAMDAIHVWTSAKMSAVSVDAARERIDVVRARQIIWENRALLKVKVSE